MMALVGNREPRNVLGLSHVHAGWARLKLGSSAQQSEALPPDAAC